MRRVRGACQVVERSVHLPVAAWVAHLRTAEVSEAATAAAVPVAVMEEAMGDKG